MNNPHIFGIRHHGPGSAKRLKQALEQLRPDYLLIEGPPEGTDLLRWIGHAELQPPVALLVYEPKSLEHASYFPFAHFSPEWEAMQYAYRHRIPVGFMDLSPNWYWKDEQVTMEADAQKGQRRDPLGEIAQVAGYEDGESWWENVMESKGEQGDAFEALQTLIGEIRGKPEFGPVDTRTLRREAWMRQEIRRISKSGYNSVAVICGAFHSPALADLSDQKSDKALLKGMKKQKTRATWIPWTYERLSYQSGYAAGVISPQWYSLLYETNLEERIVRWMSHAASLLRKQGLDASPAQVVEGVRLTHTLAVLRGQSNPRLSEMWDALETVFCPGDPMALELVEQHLIIGQEMGTVPEDVPGFPLQQDVAQQQKKLRLQPSSVRKNIELDLRKPFHRQKSQFLHRMRLLDISWGEVEENKRRDLGTFWERWTIQWRPECELQVLAAATWGNRVETACRKKLARQLREKKSLLALTQLLEQLLKAELPASVPAYTKALSRQIALDKDMRHLMEALPALVNVMRYGDVRKTHLSHIQPVIEGLLPRLIIGLPEACRNLGTDLAEAIYPLLFQTHAAIQTLSEFEGLPPYIQSWQRTLEKLAKTSRIHPKLAGTAVRLLFDYGTWDVDQTEQLMMQALSPGTEASDAAMWLEGFLSGSGLLLVHHPSLWELLDRWIAQLSEERFMDSVPLLRRTFAEFSPAERRQIGQMAKAGKNRTEPEKIKLNAERTALLMPVWRELLGR